MLSVEYIAGIFDGEGSIHVASPHCEYLRVQISISNQHRLVLELIKQRFPRGLITKANTGFIFYVYQLPVCKHFLETLLPYLVIKREAVMFILPYIDSRLKVISKHLSNAERQYTTRELERIKEYIKRFTPRAKRAYKFVCTRLERGRKDL